MWPRRNVVRRPRLGFLGLGVLGRACMRAVLNADVADVVAAADIDTSILRDGASLGDSFYCGSLEAMLRHRLDGVVIATPTPLHAAQAMIALEHDCAVFCQTPLSHTAAETARVVATARAHHRLLGADFDYRHASGVRQLHEQIMSGQLGAIYAADLAFHCARDTDKHWTRGSATPDAGCVMDIGAHLVDLVLWMTGASRIQALDVQLYSRGIRLRPPLEEPEDYASVQGRLENGGSVRMVCSCRLAAGADAIIDASFYGTRGGASLRNVDGSAHRFTIDRQEGTRHWRLGSSSGGRDDHAVVDWTRRLARGSRFDADAQQLVNVARVLDDIYAR